MFLSDRIRKVLQMVHSRWQLYKKKPIRMYPAKWESLASEQPSGLHTHTPSAAAAAAKSLQLCPTLYDPIDGSPPGSSSLGFSRQEHWSGLPFPSPMHESEKWKWSLSVVSDSSQPHGLQPTRLLCPWGLPGKSTGVGCHCLLPQCCYPCLNSFRNISIL